MEVLSKLFGSTDKVKVMRLFLFNSGLGLSATEVRTRTKLAAAKVRRETALLQSIKFLKKRGQIYSLNLEFPFLKELKDILSLEVHDRHNELVRQLRRGGSVKLVIISGLFIQEPEARVDLVVVGDHLKRGMLEQVIKRLEAEIGKELNYTIMDSIDFLYRYNSGDRFIRDVLDFRHEIVFDKLGFLLG